MTQDTETSLRISAKTKARFDQIKREETANRKVDLTQDQTLTILLDLYAQVNISKTLNVTEA